LIRSKSKEESSNPNPKNRAWGSPPSLPLDPTLSASGKGLRSGPRRSLVDVDQSKDRLKAPPYRSRLPPGRQSRAQLYFRMILRRRHGSPSLIGACHHQSPERALGHSTAARSISVEFACQQRDSWAAPPAHSLPPSFFFLT
jgi:hypothetical protein